VLSVTEEEISSQDLGGIPGPEYPIRIWILSVDVADVLKGEARRGLMALYSEFPMVLELEGKTLVMCALKRRSGDPRRFVVSPSTGIYESANGGYVRLSDHGARGSVLSEADLRREIESVSVKTLVAEAHLVVRGVLSGPREVERRSSSGKLGQFLLWKMTVRECLKCDGGPESVEFLIPRPTGGWVPDWYRTVPRGMREGQEWIAYLREDDLGLYPFSGVNSLLEIREEQLIYDSSITLSESPLELLSVIRKEQAHATDN
jgi:hypothetical protein